jgi:endonuclease YncB( thermonuclease family)
MAHDFKKFPELTNNQMQFYYFDSPHKQIQEGFLAEVVKVSDGDTIRVETDFRNFDFPIRLNGIDAPELAEGGRRSAQWLKNQLLGKEVYIGIDRTNRVGKFGRLIGNVILGGQSMSEASLMFGYSVPFGQ